MVLLVVDTQKLITTDKVYNFKEFEKRIKSLISRARQNGIEVIYIRHDDGPTQALTKGTDGFEIYEGFAPVKGEKIYDKTVNSPFKETGLLEYLKGKKEQNVMVVGLQTDYCMDATIKCGFEHGFHMIVPEYTNSTVDNDYMTAEQTYRYYNEFMWNRRYAQCVSYEEALNMMTKENKK
ncbi:MAG: cysteine hydrolase [Lachnospiraceae bacterium]|nr:cysteine hydrolase [Lachnospiraceae bacterium]